MNRMGRVLLCVCTTLIGVFPARGAAPQIVAAGADGRIYDVDLATGTLSNPRGPSTLRPFSGIAYVPGEGVYGITLLNDNTVYRFDPVTGARTTIGPAGREIFEGDLAYRPATGALLGINYQGQFYRVDRATGATTVLGTTPPSPAGGRELSGLAFDRAGTLYAIDTAVSATRADLLLTLDPTNGQVLSEIPITGGNLLVALGMAFHPETGTLYVAEGGLGQARAPNLYTLDPGSGALSVVGPLGMPLGVSGLAFVPEPGGAATLLVAGACWLGRRRRR